MANRSEKKREMLPLIANATIALSNMSIHAAKLEYTDNDSASRDLKNQLVEFENGPYKALKDAVKDVRSEINSKPKKVVKNRSINTSNLKQYQQNK